MKIFNVAFDLDVHCWPKYLGRVEVSNVQRVITTSAYWCNFASPS